MGVLRSDEMKCGTLVLPTEHARHYIEALGTEAHVELEDMNAQAMHRPYRRQLQRLDEMERLIRSLEESVRRQRLIDGGGVVEETAEPGSVEMQSFLANVGHYRLDEIESSLQQHHRQLGAVEDSAGQLRAERCKLEEEKFVMRHAAHALAGSQVSLSEDEGESLLSEVQLASAENGMRFSNMAGVVVQGVDQSRLARTLFRATRGNTFVHFEPIATPLLAVDGQLRAKAVFVVYFQGAADSRMHAKVGRIIEAMGATRYPWPSSTRAAQRRVEELEEALSERSEALRRSEAFVQDELADLVNLVREGSASRLLEWRLFVGRERALCTALNRFEGELTLRANCWYPLSEEGRIRQLLLRSATSGHVHAMLLSGGSSQSPPSLVRTTEFTAPFQELVDTIGVPGYREINPMIFTCVTFPFLFGVMFGDVCHGLLLFMAGLALCWYAPSLKRDPKMSGLVAWRYTIVLMGFFATYAGFIYNDFMSLGLTLFDSRWAMEADPSNHGVHVGRPLVDVTNPMKGSGPYPFGIDSAWHGASNELLFINSLKMKVAVLLGVAQMLLGVALKWLNSIDRRNAIDLACECVPQLAFMVAFFGYMDWMIMYKWVTPMATPPSIINTLINMGLGSPVKDPLYESQSLVQAFLMLVLLVSVPFMLIPKPLLLYWQHRQLTSQGEMGREDWHGAAGDEDMERLVPTSSSSSGGGAPHGKKKMMEEEEEGFQMGETVIHQIIETIEFVLGSISHTASYLRLWALSLAHQQLSLVFFGKIMLGAMAVPFPFGGLAIFIGFAVFMSVTVVVLMCMDALECFLHTLRLHWVEFQSKFYKGEGRRFMPFRIETALCAEEKC